MMENSEKFKISRWRYIAATVIPFLLLIVSLYFALANFVRDIDSAKNEIEGIYGVRLLHKVTLTLQEIRGLENVVMYGDASFEDNLVEKKQKLRIQLPSIYKDTHGSILEVRQPLKRIFTLMCIR